MQTLLATFLIFGVVMLLLATGVIVSGRRLRGSCGGTGEDCSCDDAKQKDCSRKSA